MSQALIPALHRQRPVGATVSFTQIGALAALLVVLSHGAAEAYVPSVTKKSGRPLYWAGSNCVLLRVNGKGSEDITDGSDLAAITRATQRWEKAIAKCSYMHFSLLDPSTDAKPGFDRDSDENDNVVYWVEKGWRDLGHDPQAAGITVVFFVDSPGSKRDGIILDADIELNGEFFKFATNGAKNRTDVENTVVHELGHLLGLDHTCDDGTREPVPKDNHGKAIPSCTPMDRLPKSMRDATMFNFAVPGETKKRTPEADDILGICETYPLDEDPGECKPPDIGGGGCDVTAQSSARASRPGGLAVVWLLLGLLVVLASRRRAI